MQLETKNGTIRVDEADADLLASQKWCIVKSAGQARYARAAGNQMLHRLISGASDGVEVDHINGDGLDNRRANLRLVTRSQNAKNMPAQLDCASPFKGVLVRKNASGSESFVAAIQQDGERLKIGSYTSEHAAARAYDAAARLFHGKFARTNKDMGLFEKHPDRTAKAKPRVRRKPMTRTDRPAIHAGAPNEDAAQLGRFGCAPKRAGHQSVR